MSDWERAIEMQLPTVRKLGRDDVGLLAESDGIVYYLTDCCEASAKGLEDYVGCRACYREIDPALGMAWLVSEPDTLPDRVKQLLAMQ